MLTIQRVEGGFPHSEILGSKLVRSSPRLIAAYHVLHRLSAPRHPPDALTTLDYSHDQCPLGYKPDMTKKERPVFGFRQRHVFACQAYPTPTAAGRGWFAGLGARWPNMLPLYDFKHPRSPQEGRRIPLTIHGHDQVMPYRPSGSKKWWSLSGSNRRPEACKATALPAELRPLDAWPQAPAKASAFLAVRATRRGGRSAFARPQDGV